MHMEFPLNEDKRSVVRSLCWAAVLSSYDFPLSHKDSEILTSGPT